MNFQSKLLNQHGGEVDKRPYSAQNIFNLSIYNSMTTTNSSFTHVVQSKAPEQVLNGPYYDIVLSKLHLIVLGPCFIVVTYWIKK